MVHLTSLKNGEVVVDEEMVVNEGLVVEEEVVEEEVDEGLRNVQLVE